MAWIVVATEDELSEAVAIRLATEAGFEIGQSMRRGGFGYLKSRIGNFCEMAHHQPVLLLTDLDRGKCASLLMSKWLGSLTKPENLIFRVVVREIESWLLADHEAMHALLGKRIGKLPQDPDLLTDPKKALLNLAERASREIKEDLVAKEGAFAAQGLGYNAVLGEMVRQTWQPQRAAERSRSLSKTRARLHELAVRAQ